MPRLSVSTMTMTALLSASVAVAPGTAGLACGGAGNDQAEQEEPQLIRTRFETEMKVILRELAAAEETARAERGRYIPLDELREAYFTHPLHESYSVELSEVTTHGYRAEIEHGPTGLRCELVVAPGAGGTGSPRCP